MRTLDEIATSEWLMYSLHEIRALRTARTETAEEIFGMVRKAFTEATYAVNDLEKQFFAAHPRKAIKEE